MFALILGGALGNLYDRIINYAVVDFIDLHIHDIHWPTFNIGDSFITLGVIGIILCEFIIIYRRISVSFTDVKLTLCKSQR